MGTFLGQGLKASQGDEKWLNFFRVTGAAFAHLEQTPMVPGYEKVPKRDVFVEVAREEDNLDAIETLGGFSVAVKVITEKKPGDYHLVISDSRQKLVFVHPYKSADLSDAMRDYAYEERLARNGEREVVLVSAGKINSLKRAYPSYFLDAADFLGNVQSIIDSLQIDIRV